MDRFRPGPMLLALLLAGCGASAPPDGPAGASGSDGAAAGGPAAEAERPPPPPPWVGLVDQLAAGDDQAGELLRRELRGMQDPGDRGPPLSAVVTVWDKDRRVGRAQPLLRAFPRELADVLGERLEQEPRLIEAVAHYLVPGGKPDPEAWTREPLRRAVAALCMPSGDWQQDVDTGPIRARALWVAGRARLKEAIPAIKRSAGMAKDEYNRFLPPDGYGPCATLAQQIIREQGGPRKGPR